MITMIIAVTVIQPEIGSLLSDGFGRSKYFMLYDSNVRSAEFIPNSFSFELGGAGIQAARILIEKNIDVLITGNIGMNPLRVFSSSDIDVYQCNGITADKAIELLQTDKLMKLKTDDRYGNRNRCRRRNSQNIPPDNKPE
jgi:predicted Fe-Mo cluster-binding NifX family protein